VTDAANAGKDPADKYAEYELFALNQAQKQSDIASRAASLQMLKDIAEARNSEETCRFQPWQLLATTFVTLVLRTPSSMARY
jgi:hypothetical protein